jgi:putative molybdopterin biosynthesis protein
MSEELMNTKELAQYLDIHEKQVYALVKAGRIPATRITGKWIFPKKLIDDWIQSDAVAALQQARDKRSKVQGALLAAGSNDPILDMLLTSLKTSYPDFYIFSAVTGSTEGLRLLQKGLTDVAWCHLFDPDSGQYNTQRVLSAYLPSVRSAVVHLFNRELGLTVPRGNPKNIRDISDIAQSGIKIINRQAGSGTRILLDYYLRKSSIPAESIAGYEREVWTHFEVGLSVLSGEVDAGIATIAVAKILGLPFVPLILESFDMILEQTTFFERGVQAFIDVLQSPEFRGKVENIYNYDFKDGGKVLYTSC